MRRILPSLHTASWTLSPGLTMATRACNSWASLTRIPFTSTITSDFLIPAL